MQRKQVFIITGADSGLGKAISEAIKRESSNNLVFEVFGPQRRHEASYDLSNTIDNYDCAMMMKGSTNGAIAAGLLAEDYYPVLINCAGVNYIDWFDQANMNKFDDLMGINVKASLMLIQNLIGFKPGSGSPLEDMDWFRGTGAILNIVSNASHVAMTNSVFYNASKGAFHIATLALARELRKTHGICIFGISPNKLKGTGMSDYIESRVPSLRGWTPEKAAEYQLGALPAGEETDPEVLAEFIAFLFSKPERHKYLTNTVIPYGA